MRLHNIVLEARKNPNSNPKISINSQIENHCKNAPLLKNKCENSFIKLSELEMFVRDNRITKSQYVPYGILCYPSSYVLDPKIDNGALPLKKDQLLFGDDDVNVTLFSITGNILYIDIMTSNDYDAYITKLRNVLSSIYPEYPNADQSLSRFTESSKNAANATSIGGQFWYMMWELSNDIASVTGKSNRQYIWNKLLRSMEVDAVVNCANKIGQVFACIINEKAMTNILSVNNKYGPNAVQSGKERGELVTNTISNIDNMTIDDILHVYFKGNKNILKYVKDPKILNAIAAYIPSSILDFKDPSPANFMAACRFKIENLQELIHYYPQLKKLATEEIVIELINYEHKFAMNPKSLSHLQLMGKSLRTLCNLFPHYIKMLFTFLRIDKRIVLNRIDVLSMEQRSVIEKYVKENKLY